MRVDRLPYEELPAPTRQALVQRFGAHCPRADPKTGNSAAFASLFFPPGGVKEFVKGLPLDHERIGELKAEAAVNPFLPTFAPRVLWRQEAGGWLLLGFEALTATPWAWFAHDSDHLEPVACALRQLSLLPAPDAVLLTPWERWGEYCAPSAEGFLTGDRLVHSDPAATNFMVEATGRVWMIDWAWAMRGPAWIDAALWGFRLVLDGKQTVEDAARWARTIPAFAQAPREGVRALAQAEARSWEDWREHGMTELEETITAAHAWAAHWR
ncbi:aminoglycoside phosphotransferase [Streptomyces sp. NPDC056387]|uniref:aminoglycoside phosphotransferase n=1 Tax=Streptomyces sp. NPDC056387 TaxID=3345803 RepID=UPI0035D96112